MWQHRVQFFDNDAFLVQRMVAAGRAALRGGGSAILASTGERLRRIEALLAAGDPAGEADAGAATAAGADAAPSGSIACIDARGLLAALLTDGAPDASRFESAVGDMLAQASAGGTRRVTVYGDMAEALRDAGGVATALKLEEMWIRMARDHPFDLLCAYPMEAFPGDGDGGAFAAVCRLHSHVDPAECVADAAGDSDRLHRVIAQLQQSANALRRERVGRRRADRLLERQASRIGAMERAHARLTALAATDALTGLGNRRACMDMLSQAVERARHERTGVALLFVDLDDFKAFNDRQGHAAGDLLLREVAQRLAGCVRASEMVCRLGGDEFTVIVEDARAAEAAQLAQRIVDALAADFPVGARSVRITASIGIGLYPDDALTVAALLDGADRAMYRAKALGKSGYARTRPATVPEAGPGPADADADSPGAAHRPAPAPGGGPEAEPAPAPVEAGTRWLTVEAAALRLGLSRPHVVKLVDEGRFAHVEFRDASLPLIRSDEVERVAREAGAAGAG